MTSVAFINRAEKFVSAATSLLLAPDGVTQEERDAIVAARASVRRGLDQREAEAAVKTAEANR